MSRRPSSRFRPAAPALTRSRAIRWRWRWDAQQAADLPEREARFSAMVDWISTLEGRRPRCLDLGCGTGSVSERILANLPAARCVGVDYDPILLRVGATALGSVRGRMTWVDADLRSRAWTRRLPRGKFDAVVSSTALHWLTGAELQRLYRQVAGQLRPGGVFLNADQLRFPESARTLRAAARARRRRDTVGPRPAGALTWSDWWEAIARDPALVTESALRARRFPHEHHGTPTPDLAGHATRMRAAGFREVEVVWADGESRVLAAVR